MSKNTIIVIIAVKLHWRQTGNQDTVFTIPYWVLRVDNKVNSVCVDWQADRHWFVWLSMRKNTVCNTTNSHLPSCLHPRVVKVGTLYTGWSEKVYGPDYLSIYLTVCGCTVLLLDLGSFFCFLILYTVGRTPWTGDQPVARPLPTHRTAQTQKVS
jgi:hypothetical protein